MKKIIKLINNERTNKKLCPSKACEATSTDICSRGYDYAHCTVNSYDNCYKDYAACWGAGSYDYCSYIDTTACGPYQYDIT